VLEALFERPPLWQRASRSAAIPASIGIHLFLAWWLLQAGHRAVDTEEQWVEMAFIEPPPPPEPPPAPEPETKPKTKPVDIKEIVETPVAEEPPPPPKPRRIQGLSASSFAKGSGTGLTVRAGTTTAAKATDEMMSLDQASGFAPLPVASVSRLPRLRYKPPVKVPDEAAAAGVEGELELLLDLDIKGRVTKVVLNGSLGFGVEDACKAAARRMRYAPAVLDGNAVPVTGVKFRCEIKAID
jgi:protein TonB